jgi:hypothetical protein
VPTLREIQDALRAGILRQEDNAAAMHIVDDGLAPQERLDIYRNTFASALTTALRLTYPAVRRLVGPEFFEAAAQIFIHERPPSRAYLDDYGAEFPEFLAGFRPAAALAYLPDVARLEWAVSRALHAPDRAPFDLARLAAVEATDQACVRLVPHPSVSLIGALWPVDQIWRSVLEQDDTALAAIDLASGPIWLTVHRSANGPEVVRVEEAEWRFTRNLCSGQPLASALETADTLDAFTVLANHLAAGRFVDFNLAGGIIGVDNSESTT